MQVRGARWALRVRLVNCTPRYGTQRARSDGGETWPVAKQPVAEDDQHESGE
jgi:hypothetical protein